MVRRSRLRPLLLAAAVVAVAAPARAQCPAEDTCTNGGCAHGTGVITSGQCGHCPVGTIVTILSEGSTDNDCFIGGAGPDTFVSGIAGDDFICGNGGDDNLSGRQGNDIICGGSGDDVIDAGSGDDYVHGGSGNDTIDGNNGDDTIDGGEGDDTVDGGNGNDVVYGGAGNDIVAGGNATDVCVDQPEPTDPSCETSVYALVVDATVMHGPDKSVFRWQTRSELGTVSFRIVAENATQTRVVAEGLPASYEPKGAHYEFVAPREQLEGTHFFIVENTGAGSSRRIAEFSQSTTTLSSVERAGHYEVTIHQSQVPDVGNGGAQRLPRLLTSGSGFRMLVPTGAPVYVSYHELSDWTGAGEKAVAAIAQRGDLHLEHDREALAYVPLANGVLLSAADADDGWRLPARVVVTLGTAGQIAPSVNLDASVGADIAPLRSTVRFEQDVFAATVIPMRPDQDVMYWGVLAAGHQRYNSFVTQVSLPGAVAGQVSLRAVMRAASTGTHGVDLRLGERSLGQVYVHGREPTASAATAMLDVLSATMSVELVMLPKAAYVPSAIVYLDRLELTYPIASTEAGVRGVLLSQGDAFSIPQPHGSQGGVAVRTDGRLTRLEGFDGSAAKAPFDGRYYWFSEDDDLTPLGRAQYLSPVTRTGLALDTADIVVLAPDALVAQAERYAEFHRERGLTVQVSSAELVLDAYGGGYGNPDAVEHYLRAIVTETGHPPRYVTLFGAAHIDLRRSRTGERIETPTRLIATRDGLYADDDRQGDLDADGYPDMAIGRIAGSAEQVDRYLDRLQRFASQPPELTWEAWQWIVDRPSADVSFDEQLQQALGSNLTIAHVQEDAAAAQAALATSGGPVGYLGHGSMDQLGNKAWFTRPDIISLSADAPMFFLAGCAIARHELPDHLSLAEAFLVDAFRGPLSVWAPTGVSYSEADADLAALLMEELLSERHVHMGDVLLAVQERARLDDTHRLGQLVQQFEYFGDPALPLRPLPVVAEQDAGTDGGDAGEGDGSMKTRDLGSDGGFEVTRDPLVAARASESGCVIRRAESFWLGSLMIALVWLRTRNRSKSSSPERSV